MDLKKILHSLENCPCGRQHTFVTEIVEIESGLTARMGKILADANFPKKVLLVSDENASFCEAVMHAPDGDYVLRVRLLSNGLLEMQAGASWLLEK